MASFWFVFKKFLAKYMCPNHVDNLFGVTVPDMLATATEPRRPLNNTEVSKGKEQQGRQDFKLSKVRACWGLFGLLLLWSAHSGALNFSSHGL